MAFGSRSARGTSALDESVSASFGRIGEMRAALAGARWLRSGEAAAPVTPGGEMHAASAHVTGPAPQAAAISTPADSVVFSVSSGGGNSNAILRIADDNGANTGSNFTRLFAGNAAFHHLVDLSLDIDSGYYFAVDTDFGTNNRILRGLISDLSSGTATPTLLQIFATDNRDNGVNNGVTGEGIVNIEVDRSAQKIYWFDGDLFGDFEGGFQLNRANYDGSGVTTVATITAALNPDPNYGFLAGIADFAIDQAHGYAYALNTAAEVDGNGNSVVYQNHIIRITLSTGAIAFMDLGNGTEQGYHDGRLDPATYGQLSAIDVDQSTGQLYFTTQATGQNDHGGVFKFTPGAQSGDSVAGALATLWTQPADSAYTTPQTFPTSLLTNIEFDEATGRYFVTATYDTAENNANIFVGQASGGAPTLFQSISHPTTAGEPLGMEIDHAATVTATAGSGYTEQGAAAAVFGSVSVTDPENATLKSATVSISSGFLSGDQLAASVAGTSITASYNAGTGVLSLSGSDTLAHYQSVLASVTFSAPGDNPTNFDAAYTRTIGVTTFDGLVTSDPTTVTFAVNAVNDAPVNTVPTDGFSIVEDTAGYTFSGANKFGVADPDSDTLSVTLSAPSGTLTLGSTSGLDFSTGDGTADMSMIFRGTVAAINAALASGLTYVPQPDYNGSAYVLISTSDFGLGSKSDSDFVYFNVTPVADIVDDAVTANEDAATRLDLLANDNFEDPGRAIYFVGSASHGTVTINNNGTAGDRTDDYVVYTGATNYSGSDSFTYTVVTAGGRSETATVNVTVNEVNDAPSASATANDPTFTENGADVTPFSGFSIDTVESGQLITELVLTVTNVESGHDALTLNGAALVLTDGATATQSGVTATVSLSGGTATVTFSSAGVPPAILAGLINSMGYRYIGEDPSNDDRVVTIVSATDNGGGDATATLGIISTVHVQPVDDGPTAVNDPGLSTRADQTLSIDVLANDTDVDGGPKTVVQVGSTTLTNAGDGAVLASGAIVTLQFDGTLTYDAFGAFDYLVSSDTADRARASNDHATDTFVYTVNGGSAATVTVRVEGVDGAGDQLLGVAGRDHLRYIGDPVLVDGLGGTNTLAFVEPRAVTIADGALANFAVISVFGGASVDLSAVSDSVGLLISRSTASEIATIVGTADKDRIRGGEGADDLNGGGGADHVSISAAPGVLDGGQGRDVLILEEGVHATLTDATFKNFEFVRVDDGASLDLSAVTDRVQTIVVNSASGGGAEVIGTQVRDHIVGGDGDDTLTGGLFGDLLTGGAGSDTFVYTRLRDLGSKTDEEITDFESGTDTIDLSAIDPSQRLADDQSFTFIGSAAFTGHGGSDFEVRTEAVANGDLRVEFDVNHDAVADYSLLVHAASLQASDFIL